MNVAAAAFGNEWKQRTIGTDSLTFTWTRPVSSRPTASKVDSNMSREDTVLCNVISKDDRPAH